MVTKHLNEPKPIVLVNGIETELENVEVMVYDRQLGKVCEVLLQDLIYDHNRLNESDWTE